MGKTRRLGLLMAAALGFVGCNGQDADRLARVGRKTAEKFEAATGGAPHKLAIGWHSVKANLDEVGLDSRVAARLHWDKTMEDAHIEVHATGSVVELKGTVTDLRQWRRAVELAETTMGVEKVKDSLAMAAP